MSRAYRVGIIGSGFGGLAVAAELLRHGHTDLRLWERGDAVGGVWRDNTYPGAACDVPSPLYSFSFAKETGWSKRYAGQPEILAYLQRVADDLGITERVRLRTSVVAATWDEETRTWRVDLEGPDGPGTDEVDVLVSAVGQLSEPTVPAIPGAESFAGTAFHSARWDHDADLSGRVAVVGCGASAIQFVPHLADSARRVTVFQRSANYILPKPDGTFRDWYRRFIPAERPAFYEVAEQFSKGLDDRSPVNKINKVVAEAHLRLRVRDPELRARLTPDYPIGCKRILFSNTFYPAVARPHVDVVTDAIAAVEPTGVRTADGRLHEADTLVWGTGFAAQDFLSTVTVTGAGGRVLAEQWADGARAYQGIHVPGFPNLFVCYGPNTNLGGSSIIVMLEAQAHAMRLALDEMRRRGAERVEVTPAAEQAWDDEVQGELAHSAWAHCDSWYRHPVSGRITSNWPGGTKPFVARTRELDTAAFAWDGAPA